MRVICIDDKIENKIHGEIPFKYGDILEVYQCEKYPENYNVIGYKYCHHCGIECSYGKHRFVPLSDIDESEFERNYSENQLIK